MPRKSPRKVRKLGQPLPYECPHCGESFWNETPDNQRQISLHRIMHVADLDERWKLIEDWKRESDNVPAVERELSIRTSLR